MEPRFVGAKYYWGDSYDEYQIPFMKKLRWKQIISINKGLKVKHKFSIFKIY